MVWSRCPLRVHLLYSFHGFFNTIEFIGFDQVIESVNLKSFVGVVVVGRGKNKDSFRVNVTYFPGQFNAVFAGQVNI